MTERKQEKNSEDRAQITVRIDEKLKNSFQSKVYGLGLDIQEVLSRYIEKFVAGHESDDDLTEELVIPPSPKSAREVLEMMAWLLGPNGPTDKASKDWRASLRWSAKRWAEERKKPE